jgi:large subunit ribosomal protein L14
MIFTQTILRVIDNSGARLAMCIKVLGKGPRQRATVGDKIIVTIKAALPRKRVSKGELYTALVVRDSRNLRRKNGIQIRFDSTACVLMKKNLPFARRIKGPVCRELRRMGYLKVISLASLAL